METRRHVHPQHAEPSSTLRPSLKVDNLEQEMYSLKISHEALGVPLVVRIFAISLSAILSSASVSHSRCVGPSQYPYKLTCSVVDARILLFSLIRVWRMSHAQAIDAKAKAADALKPMT